MTSQIRAVLKGTLIGIGWSDGLCSKPVDHYLPYRRRGQLLYALKHACDDGDFQWCKLDSDTVIEVTSTRGSLVGRRIVRSTKVFGIEEFAAAAPFIYKGEKS